MYFLFGNEITLKNRFEIFLEMEYDLVFYSQQSIAHVLVLFGWCKTAWAIQYVVEFTHTY